MKIQFEFHDGDAKAISFLTALLTAMKAEQQPEQANEEQAPGNQEQESGRQDSGGEESGSQGTSEGQADAQVPAATKDAAFSALREFISANGGEAAKALLGEFGVARFGELDEAHYGALIARLGA